jgi:hypothetical protein
VALLHVSMEFIPCGLFLYRHDSDPAAVGAQSIDHVSPRQSMPGSPVYLWKWEYWVVDSTLYCFQVSVSY